MLNESEFLNVIKFVTADPITLSKRTKSNVGVFHINILTLTDSRWGKT